MLLSEPDAPGGPYFRVGFVIALALSACSSGSSSAVTAGSPAPDAGGAGKKPWSLTRDQDGCIVPPAPSVPGALTLGGCASGTCLRWQEPAEEYAAYDAAILESRLTATCVERMREATTRYRFYVGTDDPPALVAEDVGFGSTLSARRTTGTDGGDVDALSFSLPDALTPSETYFVKIAVTNASGQAESAVVALTNGKDVRCPNAPTAQDADGNVYDTVQIGAQCWLASDLRAGAVVGLGGTTQSDNGKAERSCDATGADCPGLYTWNELMGYDSGLSLCPSGWHVPSASEWVTATSHADSSRLRLVYRKPFTSAGIAVTGTPKGSGNYWTSTHRGAGVDGTATTMVVYINQPTVEQKTYEKSSYKIAARCVAN